MSGARSPGPTARRTASSTSPTAAPSSSTRSPSCRCRSSPSSCELWSNPRCGESGAVTPQTVNVRVLAATNRNLEQEAELGRFRSDLYWRLNVLQVHVPPLRDRADDIPLLAQHFLARATDEGKIPRRAVAPTETADRQAPTSLEAAAILALVSYPWPGNVRELRNAIYRAATLASSPAVQLADLPDRIREGGEVAKRIAAASRQHISLSELERLYVLEVLRQAEGNKSKAAEILGLDRKTLYRKLEEYRSDDPTLTL